MVLMVWESEVERAPVLQHFDLNRKYVENEQQNSESGK